jgi:hypothetical protein
MNVNTVHPEVATPQPGPRGPATAGEKNSHVQGREALRWIGLLSSDRPERHDDLAGQSLTCCGNAGADPANWIA